MQKSSCYTWLMYTKKAAKGMKFQKASDSKNYVWQLRCRQHYAGQNGNQEKALITVSVADVFFFSLIDGILKQIADIRLL